MKHCRTALAGAALGAALVFFTGPAQAAPQDAQAEAARKKALDEDYLETRFDAAEQRLRKALLVCGNDGCSRQVKSRLYIALGSVLAGGKKELSDGKDAFVEALTFDPKAQIDPDVAPSEVTFAFDQAKQQLGLSGGGKKKKKKGDPAEAPVAAKEKEKEKVEPEKADAEKAEPEKADAEKATPAPAPLGEPKRNWITLAFSPDIAFVSGDDVCTKAAQASEHLYCVRQNGTHYVGTPTPGNGDKINSGAVFSTLRITLGYDRLIGEHVTVGARLGFAFNGAGGGASFFPVHAEARVAVWPGQSPFAGAGVRPFFFLSGGAAQVDARVSVEILEDGQACGAKTPSSVDSDCTLPSRDGVVERRKQTVSAYKQAGLVFATGGAGLQFAPTPGVAFHLAVRAGVTFPSVVPVIAPEAGFALGF